ncbi:MAG: ATP-binding protein, partial [Proteobacteria bacterium]
ASTCPAETIDPQAFRRVCENLVQNAAKYGDLSLPITLSLNVEANQAILKVKNFGNPISDEKLHHLFEPFTRGDQAVSTNQPGWGLGLTVVRGLVDAHNGSVQVTSSQEAGTSFVLRFPLV